MLMGKSPSLTLVLLPSGGQGSVELYNNNMNKLLTRNINIATMVISWCVLFFLSMTPALAAEFFLDAESLEVGVEETFEVTAYINTEAEDINAVEGAIVFPDELLNVIEIREGSSIVSFWLENPDKVSRNRIEFSGIIPGGFGGLKGKVVSIVFSSKKEGEGIIGFENMGALLNDGVPTSALVSTSALRLSVSKDAPSEDLGVFNVSEDTAPPEIFTPIVSLLPDIKKNTYFLVFSTQDKSSGIDYYEVAEGNRRGKIIESPYKLRKQNLDVDIVVKAVDKSGNERIAIVPARNPQVVWYQDQLNLVIIIVTVILLYVIWRLRKKKHL